MTCSPIRPPSRHRDRGSGALTPDGPVPAGATLLAGLATTVLLHVPAVGVVALAVATSGRDLAVTTGSRTTLVVLAVDGVVVFLATVARVWDARVRSQGSRPTREYDQ